MSVITASAPKTVLAPAYPNDYGALHPSSLAAASWRPKSEGAY